MIIKWRGGEGEREQDPYESLFDPSNPPRPIEIAPANSSASPPETTTFAFPYSVRPAATANGTTMPSETPMTASLMLLGLGLKLRRRWKSGNCCVGRGVGFCEDEVVVMLGSFFVSVWDSSSMVVEGSIVVFELVVLVLWMVEAVAQCPCQRGLKIA